MSRDYNNVYLIGTKTTDGLGYTIDQKPFSTEKDAEAEAEARTIKSGLDHFVFVSASYFAQDPIKATKTWFA
jgi:hypothetical protein